jgi:hypothetical protein
MEEEFNAWYETEHLPERLAITGFRSARRWVADGAPGEGKYLATYELDSLAVLSSAEYLARFQDQTPWSKRCLGKAVVFRRWACEQTDPGNAGLHPRARALLVSYGAMQEVRIPGALQIRRFRATSGEPADIALVELASADVPSANLRLYRAMDP